MTILQIIRSVWAVARKDLQVIFRDRGFLVVVLFLPAIFSMLFGTINQRSIDNAKETITFPVALVNLDEGVYGGQIARVLREINVLKITDYSTATEAEQQVLDSQVVAAVVLPADLSDQVNQYQTSEIQVILDPTQKQFGGIVVGIMKEVISPVVLVGELSYGIRSILSEYEPYQNADENQKRSFEAQSLAVNLAQVQKMEAEPWVGVVTKSSEGEDVVLLPDNVFGMVVPSFTVLFAFFVVGTVGAELLKERQEGTLRRLMAAPIPRWVIVLGKMVAYIILVFFQVALIFGGANLVFGMPLGNSFLGLFLVTFGMALAVTGMGMMLAAISKTDRQADTIGLLLGFILGGLGGCFVFGAVPLYKGGGTLETISRFVPQAHALMGYDQLLLGGKGVLEVLPQVGALLLFAAVFFGVAVWRFRYE